MDAISARDKRTLIVLGVAVFAAALFFRVFCGVFVIQPIGAVPDGATILYWRAGMNLPFIASADGLLQRSGADVSILGRAVVLGRVSEEIVDRKILRVGYSRTLYRWSTGGVEYDR